MNTITEKIFEAYKAFVDAVNSISSAADVLRPVIISIIEEEYDPETISIESINIDPKTGNLHVIWSEEDDDTIKECVITPSYLLTRTSLTSKN